MQGKKVRLRRLFGHGKSVIVPMDHSVFFGPIPGLNDPGALIRDVASTPADGVLLSLATMQRAAEDLGALGTIARLDGTHSRLGQNLHKTERFASVEQAVAAGADACVLNIFVGAHNEEDHLRKLGQTAEACERWGLPLVGEMIPICLLEAHYGRTKEKPSAEKMAEDVATASRIGAEMGADVIKTNWTGSSETFKFVVETATVPVYVAGGPGGDDVPSLLQMVQECVDSGAAGVIIGRNLWQRPNRVEVLKAICRMVHEGASPSQVWPAG